MPNIPRSMSFRICVYPSDETRFAIVAHCLDLDVIGTGDSVQAALEELLELIELQLKSCSKHDAYLIFYASNSVWEKYRSAVEAQRPVPAELLERVVVNANKNLGHPAPLLDNVMAPADVPEEYLVPV